MPPASSHIPPSPRRTMHAYQVRSLRSCCPFLITRIPEKILISSTITITSRILAATSLHFRFLAYFPNVSSSPATTTPRLAPHRHTKLVGLGIQRYIILFLLLLLPSGASGGLLILVISLSLHHIVATLRHAYTDKYITYFCSLFQPRPESHKLRPTTHQPLSYSPPPTTTTF